MMRFFEAVFSADLRSFFAQTCFQLILTHGDNIPLFCRQHYLQGIYSAFSLVCDSTACYDMYILQALFFQLVSCFKHTNVLVVLQICSSMCVDTGHSVSTGDETMTFGPPELFLDAVLAH